MGAVSQRFSKWDKTTDGNGCVCGLYHAWIILGWYAGEGKLGQLEGIRKQGDCGRRRSTAGKAHFRCGDVFLSGLESAVLVAIGSAYCVAVLCVCNTSSHCIKPSRRPCKNNGGCCGVRIAAGRVGGGCRAVQYYCGDPSRRCG
ncbi:hypothetical protein QTP88_007186 [Uroleucon formosanum]